MEPRENTDKVAPDKDATANPSTDPSHLLHYYPGAGDFGEFHTADDDEAVPSSLEQTPDEGYDTALRRSGHRTKTGFSNLQLLSVMAAVIVLLAAGSTFIYRYWWVSPDDDQATASHKDQLIAQKKDQSAQTDDIPHHLAVALSDDYQHGATLTTIPFDNHGYVQSNAEGTKLAVVSDSSLQQFSFPSGTKDWSTTVDAGCIPYYIGPTLICGDKSYAVKDGAASTITPPHFSGHHLSGTVGYTDDYAIIHTLQTAPEGIKAPSGDIQSSDLWAVDDNGDVAWHYSVEAARIKLSSAPGGIVVLPTKGIQGAAVLNEHTGLSVCDLTKAQQGELLITGDGFINAHDDKVYAYDCHNNQQWAKDLESNLLYRVQVEMASPQLAYTPAPTQEIKTFIEGANQQEAWWIDAAGNSPIYMTEGDVKATDDDTDITDFSDIYDIVVSTDGKATVIQSADQKDVLFYNNSTGKQVESLTLPGPDADLQRVGSTLVARSPHNMTIYFPRAI